MITIFAFMAGICAGILFGMLVAAVMIAERKNK